MSYLWYDICKWLDALVFSEQDDKLQAPSPGFSLYWLTGNVKESSQFSVNFFLQILGNIYQFYTSRLKFLTLLRLTVNILELRSRYLTVNVFTTTS